MRDAPPLNSPQQFSNVAKPALALVAQQLDFGQRRAILRLHVLRRLSPQPAQMHQRKMLSDREEPRPKAALSRKHRRTGGDLGKRVQHQLLGVLDAARKAVQKQNEALPIPFKQDAKRFLLVLLQICLIQFLIRNIHAPTPIRSVNIL